jgi:hypothetical protein
MKRITTTMVVVLFMTCFSTFAGGGWADCAVSVTRNDNGIYNYSLGNENWADGIWVLNTNFDGYSFGTPTSLVLNGGIANAWTDDFPGYTTTSFILYYRVYKSTATPGSWSQIALDNVNLKNGNNYVFDKNTANINLLALATLNGTNTYVLEVAISKRQYYTGGSWNCMIPGDQSVEYSSTVAGYKATFTKSIGTELNTGLSKIESSLRISTESGKVTARFDGKADVQLFTSTGQLISSASAENEFSKTVKSGVYLLRIDGQSHKVLVQ